jgi:hypothetical protein
MFFMEKNLDILIFELLLVSFDPFFVRCSFLSFPLVFVGVNGDTNNRLLIKQARGVTFTGLAVASAGDFNGDGYDDIIFSGRGQSNTNIVYLLFGRKEKVGTISLDSLPLSIGFSVSSDPLSFMGLSLSSVGDINGDGLDDVAIGSLPYQSGSQCFSSPASFSDRQLLP